MNYEKKYKEALEKARIWKDKSGMPKDTQSILDTIFPELKESEDERIRKELLEHCINRRDGKQVCVDANDYRRWADWLEKQGEKSDYNPYKATVESIAAMIEKYANGDLRDFYDNVKVKCKDAKEYDSLYHQNTWKPSDEQMEDLKYAINMVDKCCEDSLQSLYNDLKKL